MRGNQVEKKAVHYIGLDIAGCIYDFTNGELALGFGSAYRVLVWEMAEEGNGRWVSIYKGRHIQETGYGKIRRSQSSKTWIY